MKIGLRGGHSPNCKGAIGYLDEQSCVRKLYYKVKALLEAQGHTVIDCNSNANSASAELNEGTNKCNNNNCDIYIPLHMNASNGQGHGVECWTYDENSSMANTMGERVCHNLSSLGLTNRGVKHSTHLHDTMATKCQTCLIEVLFCDNKHDTDLWNSMGIDKVAQLITEAICNTKVKANPVTMQTHFSTSPQISPSLWRQEICGDEVRELQHQLNVQGFGNIKEDGYFGEATLDVCPVLKQGAKGEITRLIQQRLLNRGYSSLKLHGGADGSFGEGTTQAIKNLQRNKGLSVDGIVGKNTWKALYKK